jgi:hypothetical protein
VFVIPAGSRVGDCWGTVEQSSSINGTFSIWPAQPPIPISWDDSIPTVPPDSAIYNSNSAWPSTICQAADVGAVDGTYFARVDVFPLTWNPNSGVLSLRTEIDISLEVIEDSIPAPDPVLMTDYFWDRRVEQLSALVLNPDDLEDFSIIPDIISEDERGESSAPIAIDCLILTPEDWASSWQPLVDWNIQRGVYTEVFPLEAVQAETEEDEPRWDKGRGEVGYEDWAETIRNCIRWYHQNLGVQYVLLGADSRSFTLEPPTYALDIPARMGSLWYWAQSELKHSVTDWYYACLDPVANWQTNGDETPWSQYNYFEPGQNDVMDLMPDVFIGRVPAHDADEVADVAQRIVDYQHRLPEVSNPSLDLLIVSASATYSGFPETYSHIKTILDPVPLASYDYRWIAEFICPEPYRVIISRSNLLQYLDGSAEGGGAFRAEFGGHGDALWLSANRAGLGPLEPDKVHPGNLRSLTGIEGMLCTAWAFNCNTADFSDTQPSIVETWLGTDGALTNAPLGPCYIGNTRDGWNSQIPGGSTSMLLNSWFLDELYNQEPSSGTWGCSEPFNTAKIKLYATFIEPYPGQVPPPIEQFPGEYIEPMWDLKGATLIGDPACPLWISEPAAITASHQSTVHCPAQFTVTATTGQNSPISGARVCLLLRSQQGFLIYERGLTNA